MADNHPEYLNLISWWLFARFDGCICVLMEQKQATAYCICWWNWLMFLIILELLLPGIFLSLFVWYNLLHSVNPTIFISICMILCTLFWILNIILYCTPSLKVRPEWQNQSRIPMHIRCAWEKHPYFPCSNSWCAWKSMAPI